MDEIGNAEPSETSLFWTLIVETAEVIGTILEAMKPKIKQLQEQLYLLLWVMAVMMAGAGLFGCSGGRGERPAVATPAEQRSRESNLAAAGKFRAVAVADFDNDGHLDIAGGGMEPGTVVIWYGDGSGRLTSPLFLPFQADVHGIAVGDFNEDGYKDIAVSVQKGASGIAVWLGGGKRQWKRGSGPIQINSYGAITAADVNRDGHLDLVAANATADTQGGIQVWLGNGQGGWTRETGPTVSGIYMGVAVADLDSDGMLDIAGTSFGHYGGVRVWFGDGAGGWSSSSPLAQGSFYRIRVGDINGDGHPDLIAGSYRAGVHLFLGNGRGEFVAGNAPQILGASKGHEEQGPGSPGFRGDNCWDVLDIDLDGDGQQDLVTGSADNRGMGAWLNAGQKGWTGLNQRFASVGTFYEMLSADINADGKPDLIAASFGEGVKVWMGSDGGVAVRGLNASVNGRQGQTGQSERAEVAENAVFTTVDGKPSYRIGVGDTIKITFWQDLKPTHESALVRPDGTLSFGYIQDLKVTGLTVDQVDALLTARLAEQIRQPKVDVAVEKFNSKFVTFSGAIASNPNYRSGPGKYSLDGKVRVLEMLARAGGPEKDANLRDVRLRRQDGQTLTLNLYKALIEGDPGNDVIVDDGDLVFIPTISKEANRVYVFGEVQKPGVYTFEGSETSLFDVISQAGGPTIFATARSTKIVRGDISRPEVISADVDGLLTKGDHTQNIYLANRDLIYVPRSFIGDVNLFVQRISPLFRLVRDITSSMADIDTAGRLRFSEID